MQFGGLSLKLPLKHDSDAQCGRFDQIIIACYVRHGVLNVPRSVRQYDFIELLLFSFTQF